MKLVIMNSIEKIESVVESRWEHATKPERELLVKLMESCPSEMWSKYIFAAEKNEIVDYDLLLKHRDEILNSANEAVASKDIEMKNDVGYYQRQVGALASYLVFMLVDKDNK